MALANSTFPKQQGDGPLADAPHPQLPGPGVCDLLADVMRENWQLARELPDGQGSSLWCYQFEGFM